MQKIILGSALTLALAAGCQQQNKPNPGASASAVRPSALDVSPPPSGTPMYKPARTASAVVAPVELAVTQTPVLDSPVKARPVMDEKPATPRPAHAKATKTPATAKPAGVASGNGYKVKKGDTLYAIARAQYGDGKQWERIAHANPGLTPGTLRVGQTLTIPQ